MNSRRFLFLFLALLHPPHTQAQTVVPDTSLNTVIPDSLAEKRHAELAPHAEVVPHTDSVPAQLSPWKINPKKTALFSAILPGLGQVYNRQYWKVGLIYAGAGVATYFFINNTTNYQNFRTAYISRLSGKTTDQYYGFYTLSDLKFYQDTYKQYLDLTTLITAVGYVLNVVDALVYAHLKNFDMSRDISMHIEPVAAPNGGAGIGLIIKWARR